MSHGTLRRVRHRGIPYEVCLGRRAADPVRLARMISLRPKVGAVPIPVATDYLQAVKAWALGQNNKYGTCGPTSLANFLIMLYKAALGEDIKVTDAAILDLYKRSGNPNFPAQDDGVDMTVMLDEFFKNGMDIVRATGKTERVKPLCYAKVPLDIVTQRAITAVFGTVIWGVDLDVAQDAQTDAGVWDYVRGSPLWGGHAVPGGAYTSKTGPGQVDVSVITWTIRVGSTDTFAKYQLSESYVVVMPLHAQHPDLLKGVDLAALAQEYEERTGRKFPITPPPEPTTAIIRGVVEDDATSAPIHGAVLTLSSGETAETASDGTYTLETDVMGMRSLYVQAPGYEKFTATFNVGPGTAVANVRLKPVAAPPPTPAGDTDALLAGLTMAAVEHAGWNTMPMADAVKEVIAAADMVAAALATSSLHQHRKKQ